MNETFPGDYAVLILKKKNRSKVHQSLIFAGSKKILSVTSSCNLCVRFTGNRTISSKINSTIVAGLAAAAYV